MRPRIFSIPVTVSVLFLFCFWGLSNGANILVLDPMASRSHHLWMRELNNALALSGHNVTSLSSYVEPGDARENVHYLHLEKVGPALYPEDSDLMAMNQLTLREFFWAYIDYYKLNDEAARESDGFQRLLDYPTDFKFDLIIMDIYATPGLYIFVDKFSDTPVMSASAYPVPGLASRSDGVPYFFSYVPHELITSPVVTVWDRVVSFLIHVAVDLYEDFFVIPAIEKELRKISPNMRPLKDLMKSHRIHLVNYNSIVATAQPLMPNTIPVGGLQITEPKELPEDLRKVYEDPNSKGVVLFSLGTNLKAENLGRETLEKLFEALGSFSEFNFIWKIDLKGIDLQLPKNVFVKNWLPQNDLLGQRKTRLFITHAGGLSTQEATWYGVPMLCVPGFFDQFPNCERSVQAGIAKKVDLTAVGEPVFRETLKELLERPSFLEKAREKGRLFRDQPEKPIERALWWVEYVLRNPAISHLKNPEFHEMNFLVKHSIDVYAILFVIVSVVFWGILKCACWNKKSVEDKLKIQ